MVYQSDFSKKQFLSDGSTNFPDFFIREFGCYLMCLYFLNNKVSDRETVRNFYFDLLKERIIDYDCFVRDASLIFQENLIVSHLSLDQFKKDTHTYVIGRYRLDSMPKGQKSHFVVLDPMTLDVIYDPIEKGSRHVREGKLIDLRVFQ